MPTTMSLHSRHFAAAAALAFAAATSAQAGHEVLDDAKAPKYATGDWAGLRTKLEDRGIAVSLGYTAEVMGNVSGGLKRGATYNGLFKWGVDFDAEKLAGIPGLSAHVDGYIPHGESFSHHYGGDIGVASNIEFYNSPRLFEAWLQQDIFDGKISLRAGQLALDSEFMGSDYSALFFNSDFGAATALSGNMPVPIFAIAGAGVRLKLQPTENLYVQAALFDGNAAPAFLGDHSVNAIANSDYNHYGTHWALRGSEGALWIAEAGYRFNQPKEEETEKEPAEGKGSQKAVVAERGLAGSYKVGVVFHTDSFTNYRTSGSVPNNFAIYGVVDQELWREPGTDDQGLGFFARAVFVPPGRNAIEYDCEAGLVYKGLIPGRDNDIIGIAYAHNSISDEYNNYLKAGAPPSPGLDYEGVIELTYSAQITPWLSVQPNVQHILHPGGSNVLSDEWVLGFRSYLAF